MNEELEMGQSELSGLLSGASMAAPTWRQTTRVGACDEALRLDVVTALRECPCGVRVAVFRSDLGDSELQAFAEALAARLRVALGGRYLSKHWDDRAARDTAVRAMFNGRNREEVMRHFGISRRLFYSIVARAAAK